MNVICFEFNSGNLSSDDNETHWWMSAYTHNGFTRRYEYADLPGQSKPFPSDFNPKNNTNIPILFPILSMRFSRPTDDMNVCTCGSFIFEEAILGAIDVILNGLLKASTAIVIGVAKQVGGDGVQVTAGQRPHIVSHRSHQVISHQLQRGNNFSIRGIL